MKYFVELNIEHIRTVKLNLKLCSKNLLFALSTLKISLFSTSQEAVSIVYLEQEPGFGNVRIILRGGCTSCYGASDCNQFCSTMEGGASMDGTYTTIATVYHAKCYNVSGMGARAPNDMRFAHASQAGTNQVDPDLPAINTANRTICRRKLF